MLRFPNPGSDINSFIRIFQELFDALHQQNTFDLDDISRALIQRNLATSCGYMGDEALLRSTRADRSRDPLYNQSKMYSELYKVLGWLHPSPTSALRFKFTYLGAHVAQARRDPAAIFRETVLGIAYPNAILSVRGTHVLRPFAAVLRTMDSLGGHICRDEMIVGPLSLDNDRDPDKFAAMVSALRAVRKSWSRLDLRMAELSRELGIARNTMENYTRFPIGVLKWTGWATNERLDHVYNKPILFLVLTDSGRRTLQMIQIARDLRAADLSDANREVRAAVVRLGFYQMLDRAGFEIGAMGHQLTLDQHEAASILGDSESPLLFSPFQEIRLEYLVDLFPDVSGPEIGQHGPSLLGLRKIAESPQLSSRIALSLPPSPKVRSYDSQIVALFTEAQAKSSHVGGLVELIAQRYRPTTQSQFYPFVARLFSTLGYDCECSRAGVNYARWDALIRDPEYSIPIEIKSPTEEEFLSVKAVRQALENKVVLLARRPWPTQLDTTSLVVGYNIPNDRSEVASLVLDIQRVFGITIGIIDLRSLLRLVAGVVLYGKEHNRADLRNLAGFIDVSDV